MNTIGNCIKQSRKDAHLTQAQLADLSGISRSYLAGVEQGAYNPSVKTLIKIASVLKTDLNSLAGMTEIQVNQNSTAKGNGAKATLSWLAKIRGNRTRAEVAAEIGIAQSTYTGIETESRKPSVATAKRIGAALGFDWTKFYEDDTEEEAVVCQGRS